MNLKDATEEFEKRLSAAAPNSRSRIAKGASNAPFRIEGGFRLGIWNLDSIKRRILAERQPH